MRVECNTGKKNGYIKMPTPHICNSEKSEKHNKLCKMKYNFFGKIYLGEIDLYLKKKKKNLLSIRIHTLYFI